MIICEEKSKDIFRINKAGERHLNIYKGCVDVCPFCYWQADPSWLGHLYVYTDVVERLEEEISTVPEKSVIRLSYGPLEGKWKLVRKCMEILLAHNMALVISSDYDDILNDLDLIAAPEADVKVIMEFTKFKQVEQFNKTGNSHYFEVANELKKHDVDICVTVSPVLPGITDVERMAEALPGIPVHISLLDVRPDTIWGKKTLEYVEKNYPELFPMYTTISQTGYDPYFDSLYKKYEDGKGQIKTFLPFYDHRPEDGEVIKR